LIQNRLDKTYFEKLYTKYNRKKYVNPDPLQFLYDYPKTSDREIVGLIASSLAYGRVQQILKSVSSVLSRLNNTPLDFISTASNQKIRSTFSGFKHRFSTSSEISSLLIKTKNILNTHGSLYACFKKYFKKSHKTILPALSDFTHELTGGSYSSLIPCPEKGSACKRINLFLRWMVRKDRVDPGGWRSIPESALIIPLDTHMHRISLSFGMTRRAQANMKTAIEITEAFRTISPEDPVRYDFTLTRFGIRNDMTEELLK